LVRVSKVQRLWVKASALSKGAEKTQQTLKTQYLVDLAICL